MPPSQAFVPPVELGPWIAHTHDLLKSIEKSGQVLDNAGPGSVSWLLAFAGIELAHAMLILVALSSGRPVDKIREELRPPGGWPDVS